MRMQLIFQWLKKGNKYQKPTGVKCKQEKKQLVFPSVCEEAITAISQQKIQRKLLRKIRVELAKQAMKSVF